jgi:hypothetical protein
VAVITRATKAHVDQYVRRYVGHSRFAVLYASLCAARRVILAILAAVPAFSASASLASSKLNPLSWPVEA